MTMNLMDKFCVKLCRLFCFLVGSSIVTLSATGDQVNLVSNPYEGIRWDEVEQHRANLHTHCFQIKRDPVSGKVVFPNGEIRDASGRIIEEGLEYGLRYDRTPHDNYKNSPWPRIGGSDGRLPAPVVVDIYKDMGYTILAMTDHDFVTYPWQYFGRDPDELGMVAVPGNELSRRIHHTLSLFSEYEPDRDVRTFLEGLQGIGDSGGLAFLAHPTRDWPRHFIETRALRIPLTPAFRRLTQGDFTVESWFRTTDTDRNIIMGNYQTGRAGGSIVFELHTRNRVRIYLDNPTDDRNPVSLYASASDFDTDTRDGEWHYLAATRRGSTVELYLNGVKVGTETDSAGAFNLDADFFYIGRDTRPGDRAFNGELDHVRIWERALSAEEITSIAQGAVPESGYGASLSSSGLFAYFPFNTDGALPPEGTSVAMAIDVAGHPAGPFHALPTPDGAAHVVHQPSALLRAAGTSNMAFQFGRDDVDPSKGITPYAVNRYVELFEAYPHLVGIEVMNGKQPALTYIDDSDIWDRLLTRLMPTRQVWALATDDTHMRHEFERSWIWVPLPQLNYESVREAVTNGAFYNASIRPLQDQGEGSVEETPFITKIEHNEADGTIHIEATLSNGEPLSGSAFRWVSEGREIGTGSTLNYRTNGQVGSYVRAEVRGPGGLVLLNPFGFQRH